MSIMLGNYDFFGPYVSQLEILDRPGLIAVLVQTSTHHEEEFELLELVETVSCSGSASRAFADCDVDGALSLAVYYADSEEHAERCRLRSEIIAEFENAYDEKVCVGAL